MPRKILYFILLILMSLLGAYCYNSFSESKAMVRFSQTEPIPSYQWNQRGEPLKIAMISVLNRQETYRYQRQVAQAIGEKMGRPVLLLQRRSYAEINQLLVKGGADIALLSTGAYSIYSKKEDFVLLVMQERHGKPYYESYVVVPKQSTVNSLWELAGKSFAYTDPLSYSGYLAVRQVINSNGMDANVFFANSYFTYSHDKSLRAVSGNFVDGATVDSLAYDYLKVKQPQLIAGIRIVAVLPSAGTGPIVARSDFPDKDKVQEILLHLHEDPGIAQALNELMIDRFIRPQPELYPSFESLPPDGGQ
ncbi:PhnD/SsuA/transferrin family substrate-binding protein [Sporomusa sp.]|uniref:substrate-binding domain-containing protein n=1 Tax=Sporomusa sp. TaxID=2078658 RepID=UPI002D02638B|nr:PhnD/SsuA/transferrin family substrate-binding protein [Sporomusa sp.]HWR44226.1 PhnD/SsuA/transferrin family substrate-binding protein [Sporomusa sp.]